MLEKDPINVTLIYNFLCPPSPPLRREGKVFFSQNHLGFGRKKLVNSFKERINLGLPAFFSSLPVGKRRKEKLISSFQKKKSIFYTSVGGVKNQNRVLLIKTICFICIIYFKVFALR